MRTTMSLGSILLTLCLGFQLACASALGVFEPRSRLELDSVHLGTREKVFTSAAVSSPPEPFLATGHETIPGATSIVKLQRRHKGNPLLTDTSSVETLSITLATPELPGEARIEVSPDGPLAYYSALNEGFGRVVCFGYARSGTVTFRTSRSGQSIVEVDVLIESRSPIGFAAPAACGLRSWKQKVAF